MKLRHVFLASALTASALLSAGCATGPSKREQMAVYLDDQATTNAIKAKIARDALVLANPITVTTDKGVVSLTGSTISQAAKDRAEYIARNVDNVREVKNELVVRP